MIDLLRLDFMHYALLAALLTGLSAPVVGTYLVQRRLALMGDGIGHVAVTGVAVGLLTGTSPTWTAVIVAILGAVLIEEIRSRGHTNGDVALALLFYGGIALGVLITGIAGQNAASLQSYLFGAILSISPGDLLVTGVMALVVLILGIGLLPQLFAVCQDAEFARALGLPVRLYNILIAVLAAVTVTVAMRTVGLLLVSALMVVPVATAQQLAPTFRRTLFGAMIAGVLASVGGVLIAAGLSYRVNIATGPAIVLLSLVGFMLTWPVGAWLRHRRALVSPFASGVPEAHEPTSTHPHEHGPDCGHLAVPHDDHVDYVHDGHRHAPHGEHYDEH
ncbi:MAG: metal ABC transporter permease [Nocardioides sp.]|jgi:zinc transport system permease protein